MIGTFKPSPPLSNTPRLVTTIGSLTLNSMPRSECVVSLPTVPAGTS